MDQEMNPEEPQKTDSGGGAYWMIGIIALIILIAIVWYGSAKKQNTTANQPNPPSQSSQSSSSLPASATETKDDSQKAATGIEYTDSGFSPQSVTIKMGETVEFKNNSSGGMWVASAPHPVHTDYPEFDAKKAYNRGESYMFTFTKVGTWKFHNHVDPTKFGSVVVNE